MDARPFVDPAVEPAQPALAAALGPAFDCYRSLLDLASGFDRAWSFSRGSGWMLKVHDRKKALLYLIPLRDAFRVSMAVREAEREALLADDRMAGLRPQLLGARRAPEGFALAFDVSREAELEPLLAVVGRLVEMRRG